MLPIERPPDSAFSTGVALLSALAMAVTLVSTFAICGFCEKKSRKAPVPKNQKPTDDNTATSLPFGDTKRANPLYRATISEGSPSPDGAESQQSARPKLNRENTTSMNDDDPAALEADVHKNTKDANIAEVKAGYIQVADPADASNRSSKSSIDSTSDSRSQLIKMSRSDDDGMGKGDTADTARGSRTTSAVSKPSSSTASEDRAQKLARLKQQRAARLASQQEGLSEALALIDGLDEE